MYAFSDEALMRLSKSGRVIGLVDGTSNTARCVRLRRLMPAGFRLLSGDDPSALAYFACRGDGCISMAATVAPEMCQAIYSIFDLQGGIFTIRETLATANCTIDDVLR
jgi:4-hydroxy-tetrahydrodipicolinate synthase